MAATIKIDPTWIKKQRRKYPPAAAKARLARNEIEASMRSLDPRVRFNVYYFRTRAYTWKNAMVPATQSNVNSAASRLASEEPRGNETGSGWSDPR